MDSVNREIDSVIWRKQPMPRDIGRKTMLFCNRFRGPRQSSAIVAVQSAMCAWGLRF